MFRELLQVRCAGWYFRSRVETRLVSSPQPRGVDGCRDDTRVGGETEVVIRRQIDEVRWWRNAPGVRVADRVYSLVVLFGNPFECGSASRQNFFDRLSDGAGQGGHVGRRHCQRGH